MTRVNVRQLVANTAGMAVVFALALFLPAGTLAWPAGWTFFVLMFGFTAALSAWLLQFDPDLLAERMTGIGRPDQKAWDKMLLALTAVVFFAWLAVMALDAERFRWSRVPFWIQGVGAVLLLGSFGTALPARGRNPYLCLSCASSQPMNWYR